MTDALPRRRVVLGGAAGVAAIGVSACSGQSAPDGAAPSTSTGSSASASSSSGAAASTSKPARPLARLDGITVGSAVAATDPAGKPVIIARPTERTAVGFSAICTHMGCTVAPAGKTLNCPCHRSVYAATTGKVLGGPAPRPLHPFRVKVVGGEVLPA